MKSLSMSWRHISSLIHNLGAGRMWVVSFMPQSLYPWERSLILMEYWGWVGHRVIVPPGIWNADGPALCLDTVTNMLPWLITSTSSCCKFEKNYQTHYNLNKSRVTSVISACINHMTYIVAVFNPAALSDMLSATVFCIGYICCHVSFSKCW